MRKNSCHSSLRSVRLAVPGLAAACGLLLGTSDMATAAGILGSKHNLSAQGSGAVRAATETDVCIFCHTPHRASTEGPLWNHEMSSGAYTTYSSSSLKAVVGQPNGSSRLCLSCHDGTVAIGLLHSRSTPVQMRGGVSTMPAGDSNLGTDISNDHPVSFLYDATLAAANGKLKNPSALDPGIRLDNEGRLQCTSCHDPHDDRYPNFLVKDDRAGQLCMACHNDTLWSASDHATSVKTWNGNGQDPWPHTSYTTVADNACENCHTPHSAGTSRRLLNFPIEENNCYSCHSGTVAAKNIAADFNKPSVHPITLTSGVHDPMEDVINPPRHVECVDCHDTHAAKTATATAPNASGALAGVQGVNISGLLVDPVVREYELCFRCHADSVSRGPARVPRQLPQTNTRLEFAPANASYHPVVATGKQASSPSLIAPWTTSSVMYCSDCHNSNSGPKNGGTGANGPHGSLYIPLLERNLRLTDNSAESAAAFALCYKCHNQSVVTGENASSWLYHRRHVVEEQAACTTCHDPHGVVQNAHLINFNTTYVSQNGSSPIAFNDGAVGARYCTLTCHGTTHGSGKHY